VIGQFVLIDLKVFKIDSKKINGVSKQKSKEFLSITLAMYYQSKSIKLNNSSDYFEITETRDMADEMEKFCSNMIGSLILRYSTTPQFETDLENIKCKLEKKYKFTADLLNYYENSSRFYLKEHLENHGFC
jgi:hypothetical protein